VPHLEHKNIGNNKNCILSVCYFYYFVDVMILNFGLAITANKDTHFKFQFGDMPNCVEFTGT